MVKQIDIKACLLVRLLYIIINILGILRIIEKPG
jgi:hypothetical protein